MSRKETSEALDANVNARNIVNFRVRFFRLKSLWHCKVVMKSITLFSFQRKYILVVWIYY